MSRTQSQILEPSVKWPKLAVFNGTISAQFHCQIITDLSIQVISKLDELVCRKVASFELTNLIFDFHVRLIYWISWTKNRNDTDW